MPCTFSHPLAVIPLRRIGPVGLNFAALIIGSMSPDFPYFVGQFPMARLTHALRGTFTICLPAGLLVLGIFYLIRQPVCFVLPQPHRVALMPLASARPRLSLRSILIAAMSVLLGVWTHTIWDSFTHVGGWSVQHLPVLRAALFHLGGHEFYFYYVLQQLSTLGAGAALAVLYFRWLKRQPVVPVSELGSFSEVWRYLLLGVILFIALSIATPTALRMAALFEGYTAFRVLVFRMVVNSAEVFFPLLVLSSLIVWVFRRRLR